MLCIVSECFLVICRLNVFDVSIYKSAVHPDSLQQFFRHTLTEILTYNPLLKGRNNWGAEVSLGLSWVRSSIPASG